MAVTKEQWQAIEDQLMGSFGQIKLKCDGFEVNASIQRVSALQLGICIYVNGWVKGEWYKGEADEARKFLRRTDHYVWKAKDRAEAEKWLKKRGLDAKTREFWHGVATDKSSVWCPWWTNAKAFCRHLRKTCTEIEVIQIGY